MKLTYERCRAAAWDDADRHMKAAGRNTWNEDDWNIASKTFKQLMDIALPKEPDHE